MQQNNRQVTQRAVTSDLQTQPEYHYLASKDATGCIIHIIRLYRYTHFCYNLILSIRNLDI